MRISTRQANKAHRFIGCTQGASMMEYALLAALGSVLVIIALLAFLGPKT